MTHEQNHKHPRSATSSATLPCSIARGFLKSIPGAECHVIRFGDKVEHLLTKRGAVAVLSGGRSGSDLDSYVTALENAEKANGRERDENSAGFQQEAQDLAGDSTGANVLFSTSTGRVAHGITARAFIRLCKRYVALLRAGALRGSQVAIAERCDDIVSAAAEVGVDALIDEATGYQGVRPKDALGEKFALLLRDTPGEWEQMFPEEFFVELARLDNYPYVRGQRPQHWGKIVLEVYRCFDEEVAEELKRRNPNPSHGNNLHQLLTDLAREMFAKRLDTVLALARNARSVADFKGMMGHAFRNRPRQLWLDS